VRVNVRGSNAGVWLEASVRYALTEARSPRPGGSGVLAKLAEVLFIEVLRLYMNELSAGRTGWLAGVGDRIGYKTDTAFSRAFRREFGAPPAAWRRRQSTSGRIEH
jgi:AraC-like DNA-binding protein